MLSVSIAPPLATRLEPTRKDVKFANLELEAAVAVAVELVVLEEKNRRVVALRCRRHGRAVEGTRPYPLLLFRKICNNALFIIPYTWELGHTQKVDQLFSIPPN